MTASSSSSQYHQQQQRQQHLLNQTASELESMRCLPAHDGIEFPIAARALLYSLPGNTHCCDCGAAHPSWASVSFGTLLCLQCSGKHRSLGVATSFVRSIDMDTWSHGQVLAMLEGGNTQLQQFFKRHRMGSTNKHSTKRYHTKAAQFYRTHLKKHVQDVVEDGPYEGREASRQKSCQKQAQQKQHQQQQQQQRKACPPPSMSRQRSLVMVQ